MDYDIKLDSLNNKATDFESMKAAVEDIYNEFNSCYLNNINDSTISSLKTKIKTNIDRLKKGYTNSNSWIKKYIQELNTLEDKLSSFESDNLTAPTEFNGEFVDLYGKKTMPVLQTNGDVHANSTSSLPADMDEKKKEFIGDVDDASQYTLADNARSMRKEMRLFDNTTGEEIAPDSTIVLKKGETRVITVKLPTNTGRIGEVVRTTADDCYREEDAKAGRKRITQSYSDIDPDPNNVERVNYKYSVHWPDDRSLLHTNYYDWVITATNVGSQQISQTCEYTSLDVPNWYAKAMAGLNIKVVD